MHRSFATVSALVLFAASAAAQCLDTSSPGATLGSGDEVLFAPTAMGISFPMAGAGGPFTHCSVSTNGVLFLTNGGAPSDATASQWGSTAQMQGAAGASPRIAPFWSDLVCTSPASFVAVDTSVAGRCAVTWVQANEWLQAPTKSFRAELFSTGVVQFSYSTGMVCDALPATVGVSIGNAIANPGVIDLSASPTTAVGLAHQAFDPYLVPFDLGGRRITFTPVGNGFAVSTTCEPSSHQTLGTGCYAVGNDSFYQFFPTAAAAAAALNGQSMRLTPTANGYSVVWGGGSYVAPTLAATPLPGNDDGETAITPSIPFPVGGGSAAQLWVSTNGFVSTAGTNGDGAWNVPSFGTYEPSSQFRNAPATAFWSWHDYDASVGLGRVKYEHGVVGPNTILYVTWDAVESYPVATANPSTFQFQFNLTTGAVTYVWQSLTAIGTGGSPFLPESHLIGYSPGGASLDPGSINLATALPLATKADQLPLVLSAAPAPVISPSSVVTYTVGNVPEYLPTSGVYISTLFLSLGTLPGVDLGIIGAGGCNAYIASLDLDLGGMVTLVPTAAWNLTFDNVVFAPGNVVYAQAISLVAPNSLPNGQNAFGLTTSNGVRSFTTTF